MKKSLYDELAAHQTGESIKSRMESFGDEFERLARTEEQVILAERFKSATHASDIATVPLIAADLEPLADWMKGYGNGFEKLARTTEQKKLVASFKEFIHEVASPAVKDVFQRPLVNELVEEIFGAMAERSSNGVPFARLSQEGKEEFLSVIIDWTDYINRGLIVSIGDEKTYEGIHHIVENAIAGKPSEQWLGRTNPLALTLEDLLNHRIDQSTKSPKKDKHWDIER